MNQLTRRDFLDRLGKLGLMLAGSLVVPYIPKVIYSIPAPKILTLELMQEAFDNINAVYTSPSYIIVDRRTFYTAQCIFGEEALDEAIAL